MDAVGHPPGGASYWPVAQSLGWQCPQHAGALYRLRADYGSILGRVPTRARADHPASDSRRVLEEPGRCQQLLDL